MKWACARGKCLTPSLASDARSNSGVDYLSRLLHRASRCKPRQSAGPVICAHFFWRPSAKSSLIKVKRSVVSQRYINLELRYAAVSAPAARYTALVRAAVL